MRVLIDACLPVQLKSSFAHLIVSTAREMHWQHLKNGELLAIAQTQFDVLITMDKSIPSQQYLSRYSIALVIVRAKSNRLPDILPLLPKINAALLHVVAGTAVVIA